MKISEKTINSVLDNEATKDEAHEVARWFATKEGQEYLSERITKEANSDRTIKMLEMSLEDEIPSAKMKRRFTQTQFKKETRTIKWRWVAAIAIPFIIMAGTLGFIVNKTGILQPTEYAELTVPCGEQIRVVLQDGSIVHLNSDTKFRYPTKFGLFDRKVALNGEAYFEVNKDKDKPFKVDINGLYVEVTGTKFNVKAYGSDKYVNVCLDDGAVALKNNSNLNVPIKPNETIKYNRNSGQFSIERLQSTKAVTAWRTSSLNFYETPLRDILKTLTRQYDVRFNSNGKDILDIKFTLSTSKRQIDDILKDIESISSIEFKKNNDGNYKVFSRN